MPSEAKASLLGRVLVIESLNSVAAMLGVRPAPAGLLPARIGAVSATGLDVDQGHLLAPHGDPDRLGIGVGGQVPGHQNRPARLQGDDA